jgi:hypothetical protein
VAAIDDGTVQEECMTVATLRCHAECDRSRQHCVSLMRHSTAATVILAATAAAAAAAG